MKNRLLAAAALALTVSAALLAAQGPGGPPPPHGDAAGMLLAHTAELRLTDAQVVRLAAITRRAYQRHEAMRAQMQPPPASPDGARGGPPAGPPPEAMQRAREADLADRRDALAVLTPEQQAVAWDFAGRGPGGRGGPEGHGGPGDRGGPGARGGAGARGDRGGPGARGQRPPNAAPVAPGGPAQQD